MCSHQNFTSALQADDKRLDVRSHDTVR